MVIISTRPLAAIIQAVSAGSILDAVACAKAALGAHTSASPQLMRPSMLCLVMISHLIAHPCVRFAFVCSARLKGVHVGLARPDAHRLLDGQDKNLSVADLAGFCCRGDGLDHFVHTVGSDRHLDADF